MALEFVRNQLQRISAILQAATPTYAHMRTHWQIYADI